MHFPKSNSNPVQFFVAGRRNPSGWARLATEADFDERTCAWVRPSRVDLEIGIARPRDNASKKARMHGPDASLPASTNAAARSYSNISKIGHSYLPPVE